MRSYKLAELADAAGTSPRTVRYYVQRGLLEAPSFRGKDTEYTERHLASLRAIFALQAQYLPLDEIATRIRGKSIPELLALATAQPAAPPSPGPRAPTIATTRERFTRAVLAPGLELSLHEGADRRAAELFERFVRLAASTQGAEE